MSDEDNKKEKKSHLGTVIKGVIAAAAAGAAYLYGRKKENREKVKRWMDDIRHDVLHQLSEMEEVGKEKYDAVVDDVIAKYKKGKDVADEEIQTFGVSLKERWENIAAEAKGGIDDAKKRIAKAKSKLKEDGEEVAESNSGTADKTSKGSEDDDEGLL